MKASDYVVTLNIFMCHTKHTHKLLLHIKHHQVADLFVRDALRRSLQNGFLAVLMCPSGVSGTGRGCHGDTNHADR